MKKKILKHVVADFGQEWEKFDNENLSQNELKKIFKNYFRIFPKKFLNKKNIAVDLGSGTGRWAKFVAPKLKRIYLLEPSKKALNVSKKKLIKFKNVSFLNIEIKNLEKYKQMFDFAYSLGVIHHLNYPDEAFRIVFKKLKKNSPFLVYLYHNFEKNNKTYKIIWKASDIIRRFISSQNFFIKSILCDLISIFVYCPLSRLAYIFDKMNINVNNFPLNYYRDKSFYVMRNDSLDRFGTKYEIRYSQDDIYKLFKKAGFKKIKISKHVPYWCAIGYKI